MWTKSPPPEDGVLLPGFGNKYLITKRGEIYSLVRNRYLSTSKLRNGYLRVCLYVGKHQKGFTLHRLLAKTFIPNNDQSKDQVNHIDGNKLNNSLSNLEWVSAKENINHAISTGLRVPKSYCNNHSKITEEVVLEIRNSSEKQKDLADKFGLSKSNISLIKNRKIWKHI